MSFGLMDCHMNKANKKDSCDVHVFSMKGSSCTRYQQPVEVVLCPQFDKDSSTTCNVFPVYNNDQKWYTPAFCLDIQRKHNLELDNQILAQKLRKVRESLQTKPQMLVPKPSHKCKYCSVCKSNYQDYLKHVQSQSHKRCIKKSKFNQHVQEMCVEFSNVDIQDQPCQKAAREVQQVQSMYQKPNRKTKIQLDDHLISQKVPILSLSNSTASTSKVQENNAYQYMYGLQVQRLKQMFLRDGVQTPYLSASHLGLGPVQFNANPMKKVCLGSKQRQDQPHNQADCRS